MPLQKDKDPFRKDLTQEEKEEAIKKLNEYVDKIRERKEREGNPYVKFVN